MNSLSHSQLKTLIQLESQGKITPKEIYRRCALAKVQKQDNYVSTAIAHAVVGVALVGLAGQLIIPIVAASWVYTWFKSYSSRQDSIRKINAGNIADYLDEDDRISFEQDTKTQQTVEAVAVPTAVVAKVEPVAQAIADSKTQDASTNVMQPLAKPSLQVVDLPRAMGQSLHPTIISAKPRVGKGMIVQAAWRHAKKAHPGLTVWVLDPKPHPTETAYWQGVDRYWGRMVEDFPQNDETLATELTEFIHEWRAQGDRPTLLIIDELVKLEAILPKWYKDFLISTMKVEASSGETDQRYLWAIAQSPQVKDLGLTGGSRAVFDFLTLQRADSIDHAERVKASISAIKTIPSIDEFASIPSGVAFWHSRANRWGGVPLLEVPRHAMVTTPAATQVELKVTAIATDATEPTDEDDGKVNIEKPSLPRSELLLVAAELAEWISQHSDIDRKDWYTRWNAHRRGFSRPQFRYLLTLTED